MRKKTLILSLLALALILCVCIEPAMAYFTANDKADGKVPIYFGTRTVIEEEFKDFVKSVRIKNTGGEKPQYAEAVWVRAKAFAGSSYTLTFEGEEGWSTTPDENGWYYFNVPVEVGEATTVLKVSIKGVPAKTDEDHAFAQFNVAVVHETAPVHYNEDGSYKAADWTAKFPDDDNTTGGN